MPDESPIAKYIQADGIELDGSNPSYVFWSGAHSDICLDGYFTAAELRAIADHMDKHFGGQKS
jgi:hypothetical protein